MRLSLLQCTLGIGVFPIRICSGGQLQHRRREGRDVARLLDCQHAGNSKTWQASACLTSRRVAAVLMASLASPAFGHGLASSSSSSSTLGHPLRGQREERRFAVGVIYWRAFKFGDSLSLMDMATFYRYVSTQPTRNFDDRYRLDVGYSSATTFSTFYQMSKVRNPLYCISEWSLSLLYCMCITDTVRIGACSFVPMH